MWKTRGLLNLRIDVRPNAVPRRVQGSFDSSVAGAPAALRMTGSEEGWINGTTEVAPFPFVLHAGAVAAQADSRFLVASLLGMTRNSASRNDK